MELDNRITLFSLPPDYDENTLFLMVQSPRVLYAYWELSPGLKDVLKEKKRVQIRLNNEKRGPYYTCDIDLSKKSCYFSDVEPGLLYNCEIGILNSENAFYPLLQSNSANTPHDRPPDGQGSNDKQVAKSSVFNVSSGAFYQNI